MKAECGVSDKLRNHFLVVDDRAGNQVREYRDKITVGEEGTVLRIRQTTAPNACRPGS